MNLSETTALNTSTITSLVSSSPFSTASFNSRSLSLSTVKLPLVFPRIRVSNSQSVSARKTRADSSEPPPILGPTTVEEASLDVGEDEVLLGELKDEEFLDDDGFDYAEDEFDEETETHVGDGGDGGGIFLTGTWWDQKALEIAQQVSLSFEGELDIYAFKSLPNPAIRVRVENVSKKSGSPSIEDIQAFATAYRARLDEAQLAKSIPERIILEVSSPGVERVVKIPQDLERFKERSMYVKYSSQVNEDGSGLDCDGIFTLVSFDMETKRCTWGLANVRANREKAGKGRPLNKKQREWRLDTPFESLRLVRLYSDC